MGITSKLCNPTPFDVSFHYDRGVRLTIPADGHIDLNMDQIDDFRPGKPGSEEVRHTLNFYGVFLLDGDRPYDVQALAALKASLREKKQRLNEFTKRLQDNRIASGRSADDGTVELLIESNGYGKTNEGMTWKIEKLEARIKRLEAMLGDGKVSTTQLDPRVTCFAVQPPRVFASPTALQLFLEENPDLKKEHDKYMKALKTNEQAAQAG